MPRRPRTDPPGSWHHVMNRAVARRPMFETPSDVRTFLAALARAVRRGQLEVHAWCVLTTHFHLLVRSPRGELSAAMHRIQNAYARYFNRSRRRDGPLLRGRFRSKLVDSLSYRQLLVSYIDGNPVHAGLCPDARLYPWGSARQYATRRGPRWLTRGWVEDLVALRSGTFRFDPRDYPGATNAGVRSALADLVEARLANRSTRDDLDSLHAMSSPAAREWLAQRADLADGPESALRAAQPHVAAASVSELIAELAAARGSWQPRPRERTIDAWRVLHAGLLNALAGASCATIARRLGVSTPTASRLAERHHHLLAEDPRYGRDAADATRALLATTLAMRFGAGDGRETDAEARK